MHALSRRDFLKASAAFSTSLLMANSLSLFGNPIGQDKKPNILVLVFDAMSANHLPLFGYSRNTTPNLEKFASRSNVYHSHYSAGNFTTSAVASMLTGQYPWKHRALNYRGLIKRSVSDQNIFRLLGDEYTKLAFTQNVFAEVLLSQVGRDVDIHLPFDSFSLYTLPLAKAQDLPNDRMIAYYAVEDFLGLGIKSLNPSPGSLTLGLADILHQRLSDRPQSSEAYPGGFPDNHTFAYRNEDVFQGMTEQLKEQNRLPSPWMGYFHVWSPHGPYRPRKDFQTLFTPDVDIPYHPRHKLAESKYRPKELADYRRVYDQYVSDVDANFGQMISALELAGVLENTWVVVTSDHGELFERGELGHGTPLMYNAVTHVPLLISAPGQKERRDFRVPTSSLDLLPTLLTIAGKDIPEWAQGTVLPGFGLTEETDRNLYSIVAKNDSAFQAIKQASVSLIKWPYELIYYHGYPKYPDSFELYNLADDLYETDDLMDIDQTLSKRLQEEFLDFFHTSIKPL